MRLRELVQAGEVEEAKGDMDQVVTGLVYDSRQVKPGQLFFAVPGERTDGHQFADAALRRGAVGVVVERDTTLRPGATCVRVRSVRRAMGMWSAVYFAQPSRRMVVLGVTGTNGKTTVTYLLESIFAAAGMVPGVIGTINYRFQERVLPAPHTTPESVDLQALLAEMAHAGVRSVAMEVSSHALELERVRGIEFDGAVFTNLTRDHLDFHRDMESYFSAKSRLFTDYLGASSKSRRFAVVHGGDARGRALLDRIRGLGFEVWSYGRGAEWDVRPLEFEGDIEGLRGKIRAKGQRIDFSSRLIGAANLENILAAVGVGSALGLPGAVISDGIARLESVPGRMQRIQNDRGLSVLVDYAHTPDALERVICAVRPLTQGKLIVLFGCGGDRDRGKRALMGEIAGHLADLVVLTSDNPRSEEPLKIIDEIEAGIRKAGLQKIRISDLRSEILNLRSYLVEPDRRTAIRLALRLARSGDLVVLAGKGHEDYQILGAKRIHFDDREVAKEELEKLKAVTS